MSRSLEQRVSEWESPAKMLQNSPYGEGFVFPVKARWTNLIDELESWRKTATMFDQSRHMFELYVKGPDLQKLLNCVAVNNFEKFGRDQAKQIVCVNNDGYLISDAIIFGLEDDEAVIVGRPCAPMWIQFQAETGGYNVTCRQDHPGWEDPANPRTNFRFEIMGPKALDILNDVNEGGPLQTKFFKMGYITIAGIECRTLCHNMGGENGLEIWGPIKHFKTVEAALEEAGKPHGMLRGGARAYSSTAIESGWFSSPLPAIYSGEDMKAYREWIPEMSYEGLGSVSGSFQPENVSDYYLTPFELGYDRMIRYDHDFIGREALEKMKDKPHRKKVIYKWSKESVLNIYAGYLEEGTMPLFMEMPSAECAWQPYDRVEKNGKLVGISGYPVYSANERAWLSCGIIEPELAEAGNTATLIWGEPDGGTNKPSIHHHRQVEVEVEICNWPIHDSSRESYRKS